MLKILINTFKGMKCGSFSFTHVLKLWVRWERRFINVLQYFIAWSAGLPIKKRRVNLFFHYVFSTNTFLPFTWFLLRPYTHFTLQFSQHVLSTDDDCAFYPMVFKSRDLHLSHSYILHYALYTIFNDAFYTKVNRAFY